MALYPHVQAKAQLELDELLGLTRLPEWDDHDRLPYCQAILLEALRWRPPIPLGIPHRVMVDDEYQEHHIPAGSLILAVRVSILVQSSTIHWHALSLWVHRTCGTFGHDLAPDTER